MSSTSGSRANTARIQETGDTESTDTSVLAMVPPRYMGENLSGVPSSSSPLQPGLSANEAADDNTSIDLHSLVPLDSTPDGHGSSGPLSQFSQIHSTSSGVAATMAHDSTLVEAQVVSDHSMTMEERVNEEVEARLHSHLSAIATAQVIGTEDEHPYQSYHTPERSTILSHSPPPQRVSMDEDMKSAAGIEGTRSIVGSNDTLSISHQKDQKQKRRCIILGLGVFLVVLGAVGGVLAWLFAVGEDDNFEGTAPSTIPAPSFTIASLPSEVPPPFPTAISSVMSPSPAESQPFLDMQKIMLELIPAEILKDPSSPQHNALLWLVYDDELQLEPAASYDLYQRYILVTFTFQHKGVDGETNATF